MLDEADRRFPGVPVKAVVTTSDSWPHIGGIREYGPLLASDYKLYALNSTTGALRCTFNTGGAIAASPLAIDPDGAGPEGVTFLKTPLPRNANGKVLKNALRELLTASV